MIPKSRGIGLSSKLEQTLSGEGDCRAGQGQRRCGCTRLGSEVRYDGAGRAASQGTCLASKKPACILQAVTWPGVQTQGLLWPYVRSRGRLLGCSGFVPSSSAARWRASRGWRHSCTGSLPSLRTLGLAVFCLASLFLILIYLAALGLSCGHEIFCLRCGVCNLIPDQEGPQHPALGAESQPRTSREVLEPAFKRSYSGLHVLLSPAWKILDEIWITSLTFSLLAEPCKLFSWSCGPGQWLPRIPRALLWTKGSKAYWYGNSRFTINSMETVVLKKSRSL